MSIYDGYFTDFNNMVQTELEESIKLYYPEVREDCPNCYLDTFGTVSRSVSIYKIGGPAPFDNGMPCPYCDGKGYKAVEVVETIPGRSYIVNKDFHNKSGINIPQGSYEFICRHTYFPKLVRAKSMMPVYELTDYMIQRYFLAGSPDVTGFKLNPIVYITSFWVKNQD